MNLPLSDAEANILNKILNHVAFCDTTTDEHTFRICVSLIDRLNTEIL